MPRGGVLIIFSQLCQSSEMWNFTGIWDHASTIRQKRNRQWETMSVVLDRAEPGQALLREYLKGAVRGELYWLSGHGALRLPACGAKVTATMTSACVVSFLKQATTNGMYSFLIIHWSFLSKLAGTVLVPDSRNVLVVCELDAFPNQGTLDMGAQYNTQHAGDTHQHGW